MLDDELKKIMTLRNDYMNKMMSEFVKDHKLIDK